ncbi:MAG TPA: phosphoribosylformylglycinamidine synthase subunit PurS [Anaeromyxobacteraceae bacterium]|nr:phosphoribosylformylglycinamidine synthase subunit PurS [Anaeromyxobacteraceae bacterium]
MAKTVRVYVTLKRGVLDPQGSAVGHALRTLGYSEVEGVRLGKYIELELSGGQSEAEGRRRLEEMCRRLLANTVIEDYRFEDGPAPAPRAP